MRTALYVVGLCSLAVIPLDLIQINHGRAFGYVMLGVNGAYGLLCLCLAPTVRL